MLVTKVITLRSSFVHNPGTCPTAPFLLFPAIAYPTFPFIFYLSLSLKKNNNISHFQVWGPLTTEGSEVGTLIGGVRIRTRGLHVQMP